MRRRKFILLLGGAVASGPLSTAARAQQSVMPVVGFLDSRSPEVIADRLRAFHRGLKESGYVEGENIAVIYRWAENQSIRLPDLAAELVRRGVGAIVASGGIPVVLAAKTASSTIPVVGLFAEDPVKLGLVSGLARPDANVTGINFLNAELTSKQLALLRELVPGITRVAVLINPKNPTSESTSRAAAAAARSLDIQIQTLEASSSDQIDAAFATFTRERPDGLFIHQDPLFGGRRVQLVQLVTHHRIPAIYPLREFSEIGGLMSYGSSIADAYRQVGVYAASILKGAKPFELPVVQATKIEFVINVQTAKMLGLAVPSSLLARADEVIE